MCDNDFLREWHEELDQVSEDVTRLWEESRTSNPPDDADEVEHSETGTHVSDDGTTDTDWSWAE